MRAPLLLIAPLMVAPLLFASVARAGAGVALPAVDPLADVRASFAAGRFDEVRSNKAAPPGLLGAALHALGDEAGACAVYAKDRASSRAPAATLRAARCLDAAGDVPKALAAWTEVSAGPFAKDALVASELAAFIEKRDLPASGLATIVDVEVGPFEEDRRQALGRALLVVVQRADAKLSARALDRLLMELSDTDAAARAAELPDAKKRPAEDFTQAVARATQLEKRHESDAVLAALAPFPLDGKARELSPLQCEARLLLGKSLRKLRKYSAAKKHLDTVAARCGDDVKKRGAYLAARVAWISKAGTAATLLRAFADTWPDDALTDDVLLWLGEVKDKENDRKGAEEAWRTLVEKHPNGDMIHEARFKLAWSLAKGGDVDGARALLDDAARAASAGAATKESLVFLADRALYWRARLALAPRIDALTPTNDAKVKASALAELAAFASSRPAGWYGHLARLLVASHAPPSSAGVPAVASVPSRLRDSAAKATLTTSAALAADARFTLARALIDGGYDDEALLLLITVSASMPTPSVAEDKFALAMLMGRAGAPGTGHAFLRNAGLAVLPGTPSTDNALAWSIDWPRAYPSSIEPAASEHKLPATLLFGLAREESAFDAGVVSWAGAVGLCQLMPPTAADEAAAKKLAKPDIDALRDPDLNARLGAAHLARRMKLGHVALAIAAYNAGPGAVAQWSPHGPLDAFVEQIPVDETRNYVKKVTGSWVTYAILDGSVDDVAFDLTLR